ncbi:subtilisin-like protein [Fusarium sp. NRRL 25303]|nr:subtilisin-like protein [Fusarium sp. NRRL 25303]
MDIETCQFPSKVSAVFTRSFDRPPNETFNPRDICLLNSSNRERPGALHVAFDQNVMWIQNTGGETEIRSSSGGEEALDRHLGNWHSLPFMHRKPVSVLLASSMFQLSDTPWIEPRLDPAWIFLPMPIDGDLHQWCPRIYCNLESRQAMSPQSDNIAALGVILMELEGLQKSEWCDRDQDWISGQRSNHFRLFQMLEEKEWQDRVTDGCRQIARACLEFDGMVDDLEHPKIFGQRKSPAVFYKYILEPLCVHAINGFGNLKPLVKGMFGGERLSVPPTSTHLATTKSLVLFDDDNSVANEKDKDVSNKFRENLKSFFKYIGEIGQLEPVWEDELPRIRIAVLDSGVDDGESEIKHAIKFGQINEKKSKTFIQKQDEADPKQTKADGYTPLHLAIAWVQYPLIEYILQHGGDAANTTKNGLTGF